MSDPEQPTAALLYALRDVILEVAEPDAVLAAILQFAVRNSSADRGVIVEVGERGGLEFKVLSGFKAGHFDGPVGRYSRQLFAHVIETGEGLMLENAALNPFPEPTESTHALGTAAVLCLPIRAGGRIAALVHLEKSRPGRFDEQHRRMLRPLFLVAGPVLENLQAGRDVIREREQLAQALQQESASNRDVLTHDWSFGRFVGRAPRLRELESTLRSAASREFPVLLLGETGTGKSILARAIHYSGPRAKRPFITVSCPSLERGLVESELFGHCRGAFTGAISDRVGKVQAADGGTLFLDEVGDLPLEIQPKLLRLLEERTYERVGDTREQRADVRIVAATNHDLAADAEAGRFRHDLFARLDYITIRVPPLRERAADIPMLLRNCLDREDGGRWIELAPEACDYLEHLPFAWPHNVRHLTRLAAQLVMSEPNCAITSSAIARLLDARESLSPPSSKLGLEAGLPALLAESERQWLQEALTRYPTLTRAELAAKLKIAESTLFKKLKDYELS
jgi:transcriptional regulator with GAF, ATPase, and Fis domain